MKTKQQELFENAAKPLIQYLKENHHPHTTVIVDATRAELLEGQMNYVDPEFLHDAIPYVQTLEQ